MCAFFEIAGRFRYITSVRSIFCLKHRLRVRAGARKYHKQDIHDRREESYTMRLMLMLFLLTVLLSLSTARVGHSTNVLSDSTVRTIGEVESTVRTIDEPDCPQSHKSPDNSKSIKRLQIRSYGINGKVQRIHSGSNEEDKPGIHAYGLPKKSLQDNGVIERVNLGEDRIDDASKNGRLVEAYGISKNNMETNGFIERLPFPSAGRQPVTLGSRRDNVRIRRSVRTGSENKVDENIVSEAEDMEAQDAKVFRPLFVYRQQAAARERRKHARNAAHKNHWHAIHQPCNHG